MCLHPLLKVPLTVQVSRQASLACSARLADATPPAARVRVRRRMRAPIRVASGRRGASSSRLP